MRFTYDGAEYVIEFRYKESPRARAVHCGILRCIDGLPILGGWSHCSPLDQFEKDKGRKIALTRALESDSTVSKEFRTAAWKAYFSRGGRPAAFTVDKGAAQDMKTFEEACQAVLLRRVPRADPRMPEDLIELRERYESTLTDILEDPLMLVISGCFGQLLEQEMPMDQFIAVVFSHGVMVGMEMEKQG